MKELVCKCGRPIKLDDEDYEKLKVFSWSCTNGNYPHNGRAIHDYIVNYETVAHFPDTDTHNNQKNNLISATIQENNFYRKASKRSKTGYKGVSVDSKARNPFRAVISKNRKNHYLGSFRTAEEAARRYDQEAKILFGKFAWLNFPETT